MPEFFQISLSDLSPLSRVPKDHLLVALKSYFDGGNQADSREYKIVTLAAFSGSAVQWANFEEQWRENLIRHGAKWLHTTDAATLQRPFSVDDGWTTAKVDAFIGDCVT